MDILDSVEVRWFLAEDAPGLAAARAWFARVSPEPRRTDEYLLTGRGDVGFKARRIDGDPVKLETKYRLEELGPLSVGRGVVGHAERWRKLSLSAEDPKLRAQGAWRALEKKRWLCRYAFEGGAVREVAGKERLPVGCGLELTELRWQSQAGEPRVDWTLALEAFGEGAQLSEVIQAAYRAASEAGLTVELGPELSQSYPAWLEGSAA